MDGWNVSSRVLESVCVQDARGETGINKGKV